MNSHSRETSHTPETEPKPVSIRLEFFRHDEKTKEATEGPRVDDNKVRLTPKGRSMASESGKIKSPRPEVAVAFSSPRERTSETALRQMLANEDQVTTDMSLEEIRELTKTPTKVGKKDAQLVELDFNTRNPEYNRVYYEHYLNTKDGLDFMFKDSDNLVLKNHDRHSLSYSRAAGDYATIVKKYLNILPTWKKLVSEKPEEYTRHNNELQRFFSSHQTVIEMFLMKVIQKQEGPEAVEKFISSLTSRNGFDFSEGYTITISDTQNRPEILVRFRNQEWQVTEEVIDQMIVERDQLNAKITNEP